MTDEPWHWPPQPDYSFYHSPSSGLFLPSDHTVRHGEPVPDFTSSEVENVHVWLPWSDLYEATPTYNDVVARLQPYGLEMVLATLGAISARISRPRGDAALTVQADIVRHVFDGPTRFDIQRWRTSIADSESGAPPMVTVFHELQIVTAAKIALLSVPPAAANGPSSLQAFGEALLMVTDLIDLHTQSDELPQDIHARAELDRWIRYVVPNRLFHGGRNLRHALARAHDLYLTDRPHLNDKANYVNLPSLFERITTIPPDLACVAMFGTLVKTTTDHSGMLFHVDTFLGPLDLRSEEEQAIFALFSARADTLREELIGRGCGAEDLRIFDPLPLGELPVVVHDGNAYCPSVALLHQKMTRGLFHIFLTRLEDHGDRKKFLDYMGPVFEGELHTILDFR